MPAAVRQQSNQREPMPPLNVPLMKIYLHSLKMESAPLIKKKPGHASVTRTITYDYDTRVSIIEIEHKGIERSILYEHSVNCRDEDSSMVNCDWLNQVSVSTF